MSLLAEWNGTGSWMDDQGRLDLMKTCDRTLRVSEPVFSATIIVRNPLDSHLLFLLLTIQFS